jgi:hypothetical protein
MQVDAGRGVSPRDLIKNRQESFSTAARETALKADEPIHRLRGAPL